MDDENAFDNHQIVHLNLNYVRRDKYDADQLNLINKHNELNIQITQLVTALKTLQIIAGLILIPLAFILLNLLFEVIQRG